MMAAGGILPSLMASTDVEIFPVVATVEATLLAERPKGSDATKVAVLYIAPGERLPFGTLLQRLLQCLVGKAYIRLIHLLIQGRLILIGTCCQPESQ
ncbi:hypothetical protein WL1483_999 [Aeromonas schubertii]|uniref:Uncharacterized protein n=1 Tax=Aeromonas schubertii TaxID=652 RepID=A0A0S2SFK3_9GAMM|nr:hypothetical protein WL1483_999 [Aeromonas schubertii]